MTDRKNIKAQPDVFERHNKKRQQEGLSWTEYLRRCEYVPGDGRDTLGMDEDEIRKIARDVANEQIAERVIGEAQN